MEELAVGNADKIHGGVEIKDDRWNFLVDIGKYIFENFTRVATILNHFQFQSF